MRNVLFKAVLYNVYLINGALHLVASPKLFTNMIFFKMNVENYSPVLDNVKVVVSSYKYSSIMFMLHYFTLALLQIYTLLGTNEFG